MLHIPSQRAFSVSAPPPVAVARPAMPQGLVACSTTAEGMRRWGELAARARVMQCRGRHVSERVFDNPVVVVILETIGGVVQISCGDDEQESHTARSAHVSLVPAGTRIRLDAQGDSLFREVVIEITPRRISTPAGRLSAVFRSDSDPRTMLLDRDVLHAAELIAADCLSDQPDDRVYGEGLSIVLLKALSRLTDPAAATYTQGGLAPWQLRRITGFLEDNLADGARIDALARLASLSSSYFSRAFKVSTGMTPQRWLRAARIRRAQELLVDGDISLVNIAQVTGFADQAHLTRMFRQATGESPGAWRRRVRIGPVQ